MKVYRGVPGGHVTVEDGQRMEPLVPLAVGPRCNEFSWGNLDLANLKVPREKANQFVSDHARNASGLAFAILADHFGNVEDPLLLVHRFKHRVVLTWPYNSPWKITSTEIEAHLKALHDNDRDIAQARMSTGRQPPPIVNEGGAGVSRSDHDRGPGPSVVDISSRKPEAKPDKAPGIDWFERADVFRATSPHTSLKSSTIDKLIRGGVENLFVAADKPDGDLLAILQFDGVALEDLKSAIDEVGLRKGAVNQT